MTETNEPSVEAEPANEPAANGESLSQPQSQEPVPSAAAELPPEQEKSSEQEIPSNPLRAFRKACKK